MSADLAALAYLVAGVLFILALRGLSHPDTSRQGNLFGMIGMAIAVATTLAAHPPAGLAAWGLVVLAVAIGAITFTGSVIAFLKLSGRMSGKPIILPMRHVINIALAIALVALIADDTGPIWARAFGFVALIFASVNIFGGFLVTQRMLAMFQRKQKKS